MWRHTSNFSSPETVLVLRALSTFEALYLSRISNKMNEAVGQAFQGGARAPPSSPEGTNVVRTIANELDTAKFDPLLVQSGARSAKSSLDMLLARADGLVVRDRAPGGSGEYSLSQSQICQITGSQDAMETYGRIVDPLLAAIKSESSAIIAKLHREPARSTDPLSDMGGGSSAYVQELTEKLSFVKSEILSRLGTEGVAREWFVEFHHFPCKCGV